MQSTVPNNIVEQFWAEFENVGAVADELCKSRTMQRYASDLLASENPVEMLLWAMALGYEAGRAARRSPLTLVEGRKAAVIAFPGQ